MEENIERQLTQNKVKSLLGGSLELPLDNGILIYCPIKVVREGKTFIEMGYKIADNHTYLELERLAHGAEPLQ